MPGWLGIVHGAAVTAAAAAAALVRLAGSNEKLTVSDPTLHTQADPIHSHGSQEGSWQQPSGSSFPF